MGSIVKLCVRWRAANRYQAVTLHAAAALGFGCAVTMKITGVVPDALAAAPPRTVAVVRPAVPVRHVASVPVAAASAIPAPSVAPPPPPRGTAAPAPAAAWRSPSATPRPTVSRPPAPPLSGTCADADGMRSITDVNANRAANGLAPLSVDPSICRAAATHASQDAASDTMTHAGLVADVQAAAVSYSTLGEVLGECKPTAAPDYIDQLWMQSSEHRAIILDPSYTRIGAAWARSSSGNWYVSAILAG